MIGGEGVTRFGAIVTFHITGLTALSRLRP